MENFPFYVMDLFLVTSFFGSFCHQLSLEVNLTLFCIPTLLQKVAYSFAAIRHAAAATRTTAALHDGIFAGQRSA